MEYSPILAPIVTLVAWSIIMMFWMFATRLPLLRGRKIPDGARGADLEPGAHNWAAHNYAHLMEQPTLFYAVSLALVAMHDTHAINIYLAWGYVGFRILHSLWQATFNIVNLRFALFLLASFCLLGLTVHAAMALVHG